MFFFSEENCQNWNAMHNNELIRTDWEKKSRYSISYTIGTMEVFCDTVCQEQLAQISSLFMWHLVQCVIQYNKIWKRLRSNTFAFADGSAFRAWRSDLTTLLSIISVWIWTVNILSIGLFERCIYVRNISLKMCLKNRTWHLKS